MSVTATNRVRLLIADDHHLFLDGIVSLLQGDEDLTVCGTATNGLEVLEQVSKIEIDVLLLDMAMPDMDGIATARKLTEMHQKLKILVLTTYNDRAIVAEMVKSGVSGYLLKNCTKAELKRAILTVAAGRSYFGEEISHSIINSYASLMRYPPNAIILTARETEVLKLLAKGYTNEQVAERLGISYRTVETHRKNMMQKTKAHNLAGLLQYAYSAGLISS